MSILYQEIDVSTSTLLPSLRVTFPLRRFFKDKKGSDLHKLYQALKPKAFIHNDIDAYYNENIIGRNVMVCMFAMEMAKNNKQSILKIEWLRN